MEFDSGVAPTIQSYYSTISPTILLSVQLSYYQSYYPTISPTILLSVLLYYYQHYYPTIRPTILLSVLLSSYQSPSFPPTVDKSTPFISPGQVQQPLNIMLEKVLIKITTRRVWTKWTRDQKYTFTQYLNEVLTL